MFLTPMAKHTIGWLHAPLNWGIQKIQSGARPIKIVQSVKDLKGWQAMGEKSVIVEIRSN